MIEDRVLRRATSPERDRRYMRNLAKEKKPSAMPRDPPSKPAPALDRLFHLLEIGRHVPVFHPCRAIQGNLRIAKSC